MTDLDDTSNCPTADTCDGCGTTGPVTVATLETQVGVYCTTLCPACRARPARLSVYEAAVLAAEHCVHLGIDLDRMGELLAAEHATRDH